MPGLTPNQTQVLIDRRCRLQTYGDVPRLNWRLRLGWALVFGPITALVLFTAVLMCSLGWGGQILTAGSVSIGMGALLIVRGIKREHKDA